MLDLIVYTVIIVLAWMAQQNSVPHFLSVGIFCRFCFVYTVDNLVIFAAYVHVSFCLANLTPLKPFVLVDTVGILVSVCVNTES